MNMSREDAAKALRDIGDTHDRVRSLQAYKNAAPYFMIWGAVWLIANSAMDLLPVNKGWAWPVASGLGVVVSLLIAWRQNRSRMTNPESQRFGRLMGWRFGFSFLAILGYFMAAGAILAPFAAREANAFISLFWAFAYTIAGVWAGWRMAAVGVLLVALILFGYFELQSHYFLWMGVVVGGALFLAGLWLRKA